MKCICLKREGSQSIIKYDDDQIVFQRHCQWWVNNNLDDSICLELLVVVICTVVDLHTSLLKICF